jgi:predicted nucleic acid-binding protein
LRAGEASESEAGDLLGRYLMMPIELHGHTPLLARVIELRDRLTAYDSAYVALAEHLDAALATVDAAVSAVARDLGIEVLS